MCLGLGDTDRVGKSDSIDRRSNTMLLLTIRKI